MIVAEPRTQTSNGTTQAGPRLTRAVRNYVRAYASLHGRRKAAEHLGVSRHTLWRFLERGEMGRAVPSAVVNKVGNSVRAIEAATYEIVGNQHKWDRLGPEKIIIMKSCVGAP